MKKKERVIAALTGKLPDMVPFILNTVDKKVQERLLNHAVNEPTIDGTNVTGWVGRPDEAATVTPSLSIVPEAASLLGLDAIQIQILPPIYAESAIDGNNLYVTRGLIDSADALAQVRMPDPDDDALLRAVEDMIERYRGDFAIGARVRLCAAPAILSMGIDNLAIFYADEDDTLIKTVDMYAEWSRRLNANLSELGFDFFWAFDDIAYASGMLMSPAMFRETLKSGMKKAASTIKKPWIFHSDGDYSLILDDIIDIGASGIHPIERASMDGAWLKTRYGDKLCLIGNIDIGTLTDGTEADAENEVCDRIALFGLGGRYIVSDSNSIPDGCKPENLLAMARAIKKYRHVY